MSMITMKDGTEIYFKDWGEGPAVTLSHGWPLSSDAWDGQMLFLAENGFRAIAHDRRGHGRSSQPWLGQRHGHLRRRPRCGHRGARSPGRHRRGSLDRRRRSRSVHRPSRNSPRCQGRVDLGGAAARSRSRTRIPTACPSKRSTACAPAWSKTGHSSTWNSRTSSTARTDPTRPSRRACSTSSGPGACNRASRTHSKRSRLWQRLTSTRTSKGSTSRHC